MPRRSQVVSQLLKYGVRYAPVAYAGLKQGRHLLESGRLPLPAGSAPARPLGDSPATGPIQDSRRMSRRSARAAAVEHASHLVDGSILPVYDGDTRVWVVFSGDRIVGTHPVVRTPVEQLIEHYDLATRERPRKVNAHNQKP